MNKDKRNYLIRGIYIEKDAWAKLSVLARKIGLSVNALVRRGIKMVLEQNPKY